MEISRREAVTLLDGTKICSGYIQTLKRQSVEVNDLTFFDKKQERENMCEGAAYPAICLSRRED